MDQFEEFINSDLASVYWTELMFQLENIIKSCEELFEETEGKIPEKGHLITVNPEIHHTIFDILNISANVSKMIKPYIGKYIKDKEHIKTYRQRKKRREFFDGLFYDLKIINIHNRAVRNSIEHFDERIDKYSHYLRHKYGTQSVPLYNFTITSRKAIAGNVLPLKLYIIEERTFYNFNQTADLNGLLEESKLIRNRVREKILKGKEVDYSGQIFYLSED